MVVGTKHVVVIVVGDVIGTQTDFGVLTFSLLKTSNTTMLRASFNSKHNSLWYNITNVADGECYASPSSSSNDYFVKKKTY